jgi:imidazolonepropionase-like amidohydrolase
MNALTLRDATIFDGTGAPPRRGDLFVVDGRVADEPAADARELTLGGAAVIPGLIDLHVHVGAITADDLGVDETALAAEYRAHRPRVRAALLAAGVTTIRSVGDIDRAIVRMRRATRDGNLDGPRVHCVGPVFTAPGGHPVSTIYADHPELAPLGARQLDDEADARREVGALAHFVDGIKVVYSGQPRMRADVLHAIGAEARRHHRWLAVHTHTVEEVLEAARAGAASVEHGVTTDELLDDDALAELRAAGVVYVPTLAVQAARSRPMDAAFENVRRCARAGVRIGAGSDAQGPRMRFGDALANELALLVEAGLSPADALVATTDTAAATLGCSELGVLVPGALADLVVVDGAPWNRIDDVRRVRIVVQGGRVVHARTARAGSAAA